MKVALFLALTMYATGCGLLVLGTVVTASAVAGTGYVAYKTGEQVVVTTGTAAENAVEGVQEIVFFNNEFKATCPADVRLTYRVASESLKDLGFFDVRGSADAASGRLQAMTSKREKIEITLEAENARETKIRIQIGPRGDLKASKLIYDQILAALS